jgi:hypothetical protein
MRQLNKGREEEVSGGGQSSDGVIAVVEALKALPNNKVTMMNAEVVIRGK